MKYFRKKATKDIISLNDIKKFKIIDSQVYQDYLRNPLIDTKEKITFKNFENIFTNEIYYRSMKDLTRLEKAVLFLSVYENRSLGEVCRTLKKSRTEIIDIKKSALEHFKKNVEKYNLILNQKGGGVSE